MASSKTAEEGLSGLMKRYEVFEKKYKLPSFTQVNMLFEIDRIDKNCEFLLREIRHSMGEKITTYLRFSEMLLNPVGAPFFVFSFVKVLSMEDKSDLQEAYTLLARMDLELMYLDVTLDEKKEAEFIASACEQWKEVNKLLSAVLKHAKENWDKEIKKSEKSYFG